jgi:hypothetical protein
MSLISPRHFTDCSSEITYIANLSIDPPRSQARKFAVPFSLFQLFSECKFRTVRSRAFLCVQNSNSPFPQFPVVPEARRTTHISFTTSFILLTIQSNNFAIRQSNKHTDTSQYHHLKQCSEHKYLHPFYFPWCFSRQVWRVPWRNKNNKTRS